MVTLTLEKKASTFQKTKFQDEYELYKYLREFLLVEKLHELENDEATDSMNYEEAVKFLKTL
jgi:hypothetical protein